MTPEVTTAAGDARRPRAVVFAYHNVGVRCLSVLLAGGVDVRLVLTHRDNPAETIWFASVAALAAEHGIPVLTAEDPHAGDVLEAIRRAQPDFLFSFYYRAMLRPELLALAPRGALNMHGSLLPHYRGRVPVNWAVIRGERETGASLHYMTAKPDQGDVVGRQRVPILPDDTAFEVFQKVTWAAELVLEQHLPALLAGTASREVQDLAQGNYCSGRKPEDGRIDWRQTLAQVHNLVRGVAPPYPGAFTELGGIPARILRTRLLPQQAAEPTDGPVTLHFDADDTIVVVHPDGSRLAILSLELDGVAAGASTLRARLGASITLAL